MDLLSRISHALADEGLPYALVGGVALALHGAPRGTVDVDFIIRHTEKDFLKCEKAMRKIGLSPRLPVTAKEIFHFREEYRERRNLIAWSFVNEKNPLEIADVILTHDLRKLSVVTKNYGLDKLRVLAIEDLIAMKKKSARPQDLEDVKMLEALRGKR